MANHEKSVEVDVGLYSLEAIYKACYHFLEKFYVRLEGDPKEKVAVFFRPKNGTPVESLDAAMGDFQNELIHQALRGKISVSNQKIREYIVTQALASSERVAPAEGGPSSSGPGLASPVLDEELEKEIEKLLAEVEQSSSGEDPLKISSPWEDKNASSAPKTGDK